MNLTQFLEGPALAPPPGVRPMLDNPPNNNPLVHGVTVVCLVATTAAVALRTYSRVFVIKRVKAEDFLIFAGFGVYIGFIYCIYRVIHGLGFFVHQWNVRVRELAEFSYVIFLGSCIYGVVIACVKAAILLEWIRIFVPAPKRNAFFYSCWALIAFNTLYYIAATITQNVACTPYQYTWDKTIPGGHCVNVPAVNVVSAGINLVSDVAIIILPQQVIWQLHMSMKNKVGISLIFAVGVFGCVAAILRVVVTIRYERSDDVTYDVSPVALWALGEMTSVFLVACVPAAPKIFTSEGIVTRVASRFASWTGLSSRKPSSEFLASPYAPENSGRQNKYRNIYDNDTLLLETVTSAKDVPASCETIEGQLAAHTSPSPHIVRTTDIRQEAKADGNEGDGTWEGNLRKQHPWID
ncbi:hypothetical protein F4802DRAFT_614585 [Xylaria palmicola]|nr:hypothetical protein F4802DRAFT_614585 [Xylaria palmicola]